MTTLFEEVSIIYKVADEEQIYFENTKEYFSEVMSDYSIGNYKSTIVMLYAVAICDLLFKLKELKDMHEDEARNSAYIS